MSKLNANNTLADSDTVRSVNQSEASALSPAPVTATETEAAAIVSREPTESEVTETTEAATMDNAEIERDAAEELAELQAAESLAAYVGQSSARNAVVADRATFKAIIGMSLSMLTLNASRTLKGQDAAPNLDAFAQNEILASMALAGTLVWRNESNDKRDSEDKIREMRAEADAVKRARLAASYVKEFGTGRRMADGAANLKRNAERLAEFFRKDSARHPVIAAASDCKGNHIAAFPAFRLAVEKQTGCTGSGTLAEFLANHFGRATPKSAKGRKAKAEAAASAPDATVTAPATEATEATEATAPDTLVLPAPAPEVKTVTRIVEPDPATMNAASRLSRVLAIADHMSDDEFESLFQRIATERDTRQAIRAEAALEAMRAEEAEAARIAAEKAEAVLQVEMALAPAAPVAPKAKRRTITAKAA